MNLFRSGLRSSQATILLMIAGVCAAISIFFGLRFASGDWTSLTFVAVVSAAWLALSLALGWYALKTKRLSRAAQDPRRMAGHGAPFKPLNDAIEKTLVESGGVQKRTTGAHALIKQSPNLLPDGWRPASFLPVGQGILISIGLFGTFWGLSAGLMASIPCIDGSGGAEYLACVEDAREALGASSEATDNEDNMLAMQHGMSLLLAGARTAFSKSLAGIGLGLSYMMLWRLVVRLRDRWLEELLVEVDSRYPYISPAGLHFEQQQALIDCITTLAANQPDSTAIVRAGRDLQAGAHALVEVSGGLSDVIPVLKEFNADQIAAEVSRGVRAAVEDRLAPTLERISTELQILHTMKKETDEAVTRQLETLVDRLERDALRPMAEQVQKTNEQTQAVAGTVQRLASTVEASTAAVTLSSQRMEALTGNLEHFQRDTMTKLQGFALDLKEVLEDFNTRSSRNFEVMATSIQRSVDAAVQGMEAQRAAFSASADEARQAFASQTAALTQAGDVASAEIKAAGEEARDALREVRGEFAAALTSQRTALEGILTSLQTAFQGDLEQRQEFQALTGIAVRRVEALVAQTQIDNAVLAQNAREAVFELPKVLQSSAKNLQLHNEAMDKLQTALADHLENSHKSHLDFLAKEDAHLSEVLGNIYGLVNNIASVSREIRQGQIATGTQHGLA